MREVKKAPSHHEIEAGFTLLELLVVVALLATVAFIATGTYGKVNDEAAVQLVYVEMAEIAQAVKRFKADTGYYPGQGPFQYSGVGAGEIESSNLPSSVDAAWLADDSNFYLLITPVSPLPSKDFDPSTGLGWRGPYLTGFEDGWVNVSSGWSYAAYSSSDVPGIADPFWHAASTGSQYAWTEKAKSTCADEKADSGACAVRNRWGRPYRLIVESTYQVLQCFGLDGKAGTLTYDSDEDTLTSDSSDDILLRLP